MIIKTFLQTARDFNEHEILKKFHEGMLAYSLASDLPVTCYIDLEDVYSPCHVAVMFGSWKNREKGHHITRTSIAQNANCFICIETPLLNRSVHEQNTQYRVGVNGFLNNSGIFTDTRDDYPADRFENLKINWPGWKNNPDGHILLMLQLPGDASLRGHNIYDWAFHTVQDLRNYTDKKIVIRPHPLAPLRSGEEFYDFFFKLHNKKLLNVSVSDINEKTLSQDLAEAFCSISFTSGSAIDSILHGIPTIATDPGNFAYEISSQYPEEILNVKRATNEQVYHWLKKLAYHQWSSDEMHSGKVWEYLYPIVKLQTEINRFGDVIDKKKKK
jgi:hypothetical protein